MSSRAKFIAAMAPGAQSGWAKFGVLPSLTIAQAILESGWGKSGLSKAPNYNLFGVKANGWKEPNVCYFKTKEYEGGQYVTITAAFRKYDSWASSIFDHAKFIYKNKRYHNLLGVSNYKQACTLIRKDGYATSPTYTSNLIEIIEENKLYKYDTSSSTPSNPTPKPEPKPEPKPTCSIEVGKTVKVHGMLYSDSYGSNAAKTISGSYKIDRIISGRAAGVLIGGGLGWVSKSSCSC